MLTGVSVYLLKLPKSNTKESDTHYDLCPSNEKDNQLVATATKKGPLCKKKLPNFPDNVQATGFVDDKNFHLMANGKVISFEKDAIGDKLGKPVPFTITESKDFFVKEDAPGGGGDGGGGKSGKGGKHTFVRLFQYCPERLDPLRKRQHLADHRRHHRHCAHRRRRSHLLLFQHEQEGFSRRHR